MRGLLFLLVGTSGCLLVDATVDLNPAPTSGAISRNGGVVVLVPVADRARTSGRVGIKKNGIGAKSAVIHSKVPVATWLGRRLRNELTTAGFEVLDTAAGAPRIEIAVLDFFAEPDVGVAFEVHALVHAEVTVELPDGRRFARRFAQRRRTGAITLTGGLYEELLDEVVDAWMAEAIPAIVNLIESGPSNASLSTESWRWLG